MATATKRKSKVNIQPLADRVVVLPLISHGGDVANAQLGAVRLAPQDDVTKLLAAIAPLGRSKQDLSRVGLHAPTRKLDRCGTYPRGDLVQGQAVLS